MAFSPILAGGADKRFLTLLMVLLLAGCAAPVAKPPAAGPWLARQEILANLSDWDISGRIGIINAQEGWHASLQWKQRGPVYAIDLLGPWGQGRVRIEGDAQSVRVRTADGQVRRASDPEQLLVDTLGMRIPLKGLFYWVRGLPDPDRPSELQGDEFGRLNHLQQDGWDISYSEYMTVGSTDLPAQIRARQDEWQVRIAIKAWDLQPPPLQTLL
ncbi:MAG: outer membrane lipoprotein LolB [Gammaproteobacteria bacterium]|nr:outer membrane lipoprotein LolB [Gammaproteobacteria bacterium]MCP5424218.1 outer membrane lipoprotein LolB [Gammaproteobacteria bacterium]MCP5458905.1 outer membrane lipoprotein LolB [Gammaproteobacteria bacterium]